MFRIILFCIILSFIQSVTIEYPPNEFIQKHDRKDIDPILKHYVIQREIQFRSNATDNNSLPYFLKCKGSRESIRFTFPPNAKEYLSLVTDPRTNTITATLLRNQLTSDLVGRYTCSETNNNNKLQKSVYVYIQDGHAVFTKKSYPTVYRGTGIHFFNIPCQTTNWYTRMTCPSINSTPCNERQCSSEEEQELCIPVYYTPSNFELEKVLFDPQIGFALVKDTQLVLDGITKFICMTNYTTSEKSTVPLNSSQPYAINIYPTDSLKVLSDETVTLTCETAYPFVFDKTLTTLFWFNDIYDLQLKLNKTDERVIDKQKQIRSKNSTIILDGFKPNRTYRFYCARASEGGVRSKSINVTCVNAPSIQFGINSQIDESNGTVIYGLELSYDIKITIIPCSPITLNLSRNGKSLADDKRFELLLAKNEANQTYRYSLAIYNITFEDEADLKISVKSSHLENTTIIRPIVKGDPVGELSFISQQSTSSIPQSNDNFEDETNIYSYGISPQESYQIVCTVQHQLDQQDLLDVFIQYSTCQVETCLSNFQSKTCRTSSNEQVLPTKPTQSKPYETQYISVGSHKLDNPSIGHQYLCCYRNQSVNTIAKAITVLSNHRNMFHVKKSESDLFTGQSLTYGCEAHKLFYNDIKIIYDDNSNTYERNSLDNQWRSEDAEQKEQPIGIEWNLLPNDTIRSTAIEIKALKLNLTANDRSLQCIAISKQSDLIRDANDVYYIVVQDPIPLTFQNNMSNITELNQKANDNVVLDCRFDGLPKPRVTWFKDQLPIDYSNKAYQFGKDNESISITRAQASETGYYTCKLNNSFDEPLQRNFKLHVEGINLDGRLSRIIYIIIIGSIVLFLIMLILLIIFAVKFFQMKRQIHKSPFYQNQGDGAEDKTQSAMSQVTRMALPDNFAPLHVIRIFLSYLNGGESLSAAENFQELGKGKFGVVYQVQLPVVGLVAAKALPEKIRKSRSHRDKRKKKGHIEENIAMLSEQENQMKKAAEMLIDEIKIMHKAGKHMNIVGLRSVAYPEARLRHLFTGGLMQDEDSFYLMELCSNGSLESMLKCFIHQSYNKLSLYQILSRQNNLSMTVAEAVDQCTLTNDDLTLIAYQVALGIDYLNRIQIVHSDIAARNVLVTSRFIMKICDFGLATSTTYTSYRDQLAKSGTVHLEKTTTEIATHNLTPELARALLNASTANERSLLNTCSMKSDAWSFGIFLWTLFLKCRIRPFDNLLEETKRNGSGGGNFFNSLAHVISEGNVLRYINYDTEIPRNIYEIIQKCLVEEDDRPEMTDIKRDLSYTDMLSKRAFEHYKAEYNQYQEQITNNVQRFGEVQGVRNLPDDNNDNHFNKFHPHHDTHHTTNHSKIDNNIDYPEQYGDSYLMSINKDSHRNSKDNDSLVISQHEDSNTSSIHIEESPIPFGKYIQDEDSYLPTSDIERPLVIQPQRSVRIDDGYVIT